jgi:type IX secretion system PorP/SprF family membrane protein
MRCYFAVIFSLIIALNIKAQQDPQYNLYQFNQMIINPAYAGAKEGLSIAGSVRNQFTGIDGAPKTTCLSIHNPILNKNLGIGLTLINDAMGPRNLYGIYGNIAYILKITKSWKLSFGFNGGYNRYQFDFNKLTFKTAETNALFYQNQNYNALDLNAGIYLRSKGFFAGFSSSHLQNNTLYDYKIPSDTTSGKTGTFDFTYRLRTHFTFNLGKSFKINDNLIFAPTFLIRSVNETLCTDVNLNVLLFSKLWLGAMYKSASGPGFLMQYYVTNNLKIAYCFDTGLNYAAKLGASHEVMIGFDLNNKSKTKMLNPRFL